MMHFHLTDMKYSNTKTYWTKIKASLKSVFQVKTQVYMQLKIFFLILGHGTPSHAVTLAKNKQSIKVQAKYQRSISRVLTEYYQRTSKVL